MPPVLAAEPVDPATVRGRVDALLSDFLSEKARTAADLRHPGEATEALRGFLGAGGKRIRSVLCVAGWLAAGGGGDVGAVLRVAASLEMFVAFALVHDDLMDRSATRRGQPAVHVALAERHRDRAQPWRIGENAALLIGNFALIWHQELLHTAELTSEQRRTVHRINDTMLAEVMFGQYRDLLGSDQADEDVGAALEIVRYKTATGTVQRPLQLGAAVASADTRVLDACTAVGLPLGEAFQLRDDLLGVFGSPSRTGKPNLDDLREGKRTVLLALALRRADAGQRRLLRSLVGREDLDETGAATVRAVFEASGAREGVERMITERYRQALRALDEAPFTPVGTAMLRELALAATARTT